MAGLAGHVWSFDELFEAVLSKTHSVLSHRGAAMVDRTWLNLAAERGRRLLLGDCI